MYRSNAGKPVPKRIRALKVFSIVVLVLVALVVCVRLFGAYRWSAETQELQARLDDSRVPVRPQTVDFRELAGLPAPVQHYFRAALTEGRPMVAGASLKLTGTFNMGKTTDRWKPFTSDQKVVTQKPGFDWNARVAMMPGLPVRVHDSYVAGKGTLHASILGLFTVADERGAGDIAEGELMRFFAEAAWYPTALLPSQGVRWEAVDESSARATLTEGDTSLTMLFTFDGQGLIETVRAEKRGGTVDSDGVPTPWRCRFWSYEERGGMRVPLGGEAAWLPPEGEKPYFRGRITEIDYEFQR